MYTARPQLLKFLRYLCSFWNLPSYFPESIITLWLHCLSKSIGISPAGKKIGFRDRAAGLDRAINCFTIFLCWAPFSQLPFFERLTLRWFRSKWRRKMLCQTHPCANCAFLCLPNMEEIAFICKTQRVN